MTHHDALPHMSNGICDLLASYRAMRHVRHVRHDFVFNLAGCIISNGIIIQTVQLERLAMTEREMDLVAETQEIAAMAIDYCKELADERDAYKAECETLRAALNTNGQRIVAYLLTADGQPWHALTYDPDDFALRVANGERLEYIATTSPERARFFARDILQRMAENASST